MRTLPDFFLVQNKGDAYCDPPWPSFSMTPIDSKRSNSLDASSSMASGTGRALWKNAFPSGIILISFDSKETGTLFGLINGLISSSAFAGFTVSLRWRKKVPKLTTVSLGGIIAASASLLVLLFYDTNILISLKNTSLSALHGFLVCSALILYSSNAKYLPAADLTLLSLTEVLGGIFWVWLPFLGINEIPSTNTIIGGTIIIIAIIFYGYNARRYRFRY